MQTHSRTRRVRQPLPLTSLRQATRVLRASVKALEVLRGQGRLVIYRLHGTRQRLVETRQVRKLQHQPRVVARARRAAAS